MTKYDRVEISTEYPDPPHGPDVQYPHCDSLVLHSPGVCKWCDGHPEWQNQRETLGIAFSDYSEAKVKELRLSPCPSTAHRPASVRDQWHGNMPGQYGTGGA